MPAGSLQKDHPYNLLSRLGVQRISENTYYQDGGTVRPVPYPFEIFGAHVSGRKWSFAPAGQSCYLVDELFDRSQVWSAKQGLFLYATGPDSLKRGQGPPGLHQGHLRGKRPRSQEVKAYISGSQLDRTSYSHALTTNQIHVMEYQGHHYNRSDALVSSATLRGQYLQHADCGRGPGPVPQGPDARPSLAPGRWRGCDRGPPARSCLLSEGPALDPGDAPAGPQGGQDL